MQTGWVLGMVAAAMTVAWAGTNAMQNLPPPADVDMTATTASIARPEPKVARSGDETFVIHAVNNDAPCMVTKRESLSPGYSSIRVTQSCEQLLPGLASAKFWREREDGSIALSAGASDPIAEFSEGDGAEYESYAPSSAMLTIKRQ